MRERNRNLMRRCLQRHAGFGKQTTGANPLIEWAIAKWYPCCVRHPFRGPRTTRRAPKFTGFLKCFHYDGCCCIWWWVIYMTPYVAETISPGCFMSRDSKASRTWITIQYSLCPARRFSVGYVVLAKAARDPVISAVRKGVDCLSSVIRTSISTQVERGCLLSIIARVDPAKTNHILPPPSHYFTTIHTSSNPQHTNIVPKIGII